MAKFAKFVPLSPTQLRRLKAIRGRTNAPSVGEVIGRAIAVYEKLVELQSAGWTPGVFKSSGYATPRAPDESVIDGAVVKEVPLSPEE